MNFRAALDDIISRWGGVGSYVTPAYKRLPSGLQREIAETISGLIENVMRPTLLQFIMAPVKLKDGTTVQGQSSFDRMVREDKDVLALIEKYRPSYLFYLDKARKNREYIAWDSERFTASLSDFLEESGILVGPAGRAYLRRTIERFRQRIYR